MVHGDTIVEGEVTLPADAELAAGVLCTDKNDRPLMVTAVHAARRLGLVCRLVGVLALDAHKRLWVRRSAIPDAPFANLWHVSASDLVRAAEAREDTALRVIRQQFAPSPDAMGFASLEAQRLVASSFDDWLVHHPLNLFDASPHIPGCERLQVTLFHTARLPENFFSTKGNTAQSMLLTHDELKGLVREAPELFSPVLRWLAGQGWDQSRVLRKRSSMVA